MKQNHVFWFVVLAVIRFECSSSFVISWLSHDFGRHSRFASVEETQDEWTTISDLQVIANNEEEEEELEWLTDREKAKWKRQPQEEEKSETDQKKIPSPYNEEEEEVIAAMGGRVAANPKREPGFLGDSTLEEIATDYSVPICYLADVLCMWGVPVPIHPQDRLGDLVTGEQAFAILEAVNSLDVAALQDRYSNQNLMDLCESFDIELKDAFEMAMKEGWSLPFGVRTCLRSEQEDELIRVLGTF